MSVADYNYSTWDKIVYSVQYCADEVQSTQSHSRLVPGTSWRPENHLIMPLFIEVQILQAVTGSSIDDFYLLNGQNKL